MKIEVLYFDGCRNHQPAVERVRQLLSEEGVSAELLEVNVTDASIAQELGFLGSPSVRVNGLDVEPGARTARDYGMMCRTYAVNGRREGVPSRDILRRAIREANSGVNSDSGPAVPNRSKNATSWFAAGSVFAAIAASFCCILPIVFALTGFSILGASAIFDAWRPYLLGLTFGLLGLGFYFAYRPTKERCAPGSACAMPVTKRSRASDALACDCCRSLVCGVSILLRCGRRMAACESQMMRLRDYRKGNSVRLIAITVGLGLAGGVAVAKEATAEMKVPAMDCAACTVVIKKALTQTKGVKNVDLNVDKRTAVVVYEDTQVTQAEIQKTIEKAGFKTEQAK